MNLDSGPKREKMQAEANVLRARLGRTLAALADRRHHAFNLRRQASRHLLPMLVAGAGLAGGAGFWVYHFRQRKRRLRADRLRALIRSWQHPSRVARSNARTLGAAIVGRLVIGTAASVAIWLAKDALAMIVAKVRQKVSERRA